MLKGLTKLYYMLHMLYTKAWVKRET